MGSACRSIRTWSCGTSVRPIVFRVIRVHDDWHTYHGWLWLDGYEADARGDAVTRRANHVQPAGLRC
ncbi:hypothetical protein ABT023_02570 [Micromonospora sp. NPDC002296]|uniref:hypothetical protein n=1 Tax=Micromonospora sp. NPDC002296 TaxID=3154271 RepID=UPI003325B291